MINCGLDSHGVFLVIPRNIIGKRWNYLESYGIICATLDYRWCGTGSNIETIMKDGNYLLVLKLINGDINCFSYKKDNEIITIYENE